VSDGLVFVQEARNRTRRYDMIFLDAFDAHGRIPKHLTTKEFLHATQQLLNPGGVVVANFIGKSLIGHFQAAFEHSFVLTVDGYDNFIMVTTPEPIDRHFLVERARQVNQNNPAIQFDLGKLIKFLD
jgi:spermidine synthase